MSSITRDKFYYDVNLADKSIVGVASKPKINTKNMVRNSHAATALNSIDVLLGHAIHSAGTSSDRRIYIRMDLSDDPIPRLEHRDPTDLTGLCDGISFVVEKIMGQYRATYSKACFLRKLLDRVMIFFKRDASYTPVEQIYNRIKSKLSQDIPAPRTEPTRSRARPTKNTETTRSRDLPIEDRENTRLRNIIIEDNRKYEITKSTRRPGKSEDYTIEELEEVE